MMMSRNISIWIFFMLCGGIKCLDFNMKNFNINDLDLFENNTEIDEFLNSLNNQTVNGYNDQMCFKQILEIFNATANREMWALELIDSWGKIPSGILWMHLTSLGNFEECLRVTKPKTEKLDKIEGQYCLVSIPFSKDMMSFEKKSRAVNLAGQYGFSLGTCIPRLCNIQFLYDTAKKYTNLTNNITVSEQSCTNTDPVVYKTIDIAAIVIFSVLGVILLSSTIYDYVAGKLKRPKNQIIIAFSLLTNGRKIFTMKRRSSPDVINCLDGIRFLSIVWVVFGHTLIVIAFLSNINLKVVIVEWPQTMYSLLVQSATVSVDSFFLLSGLLVAWVILKQLDKSNGRLNIFVMYLHRYFRLTPLLIFVILFSVSLIRYVGSGPFWNMFMTMISNNCEENWWKTLLYIQNYVDPEKMCLGHTWYLAVDTQLYVLSPLILIPLWKWGMKFGWVIFVLMASSIGYTFAVFMDKGYTLLMKDGIFNPDRQLKIYYPTHTRVSPWLVGILLGYFLHLYKGKRIHISKVVLILGWIISLFTIFAIVFGPYHRLKPDSKATTLEGAFYECFSRVSWSIALSWIIFTCTKGYGGIVNEFLSLPFWQPLSRLTYSIYITHMIIQVTVSAITKSDSHFSNFEMMARFYSDFGMTLVISTFAVLAFESPILGLEKLIFKRDRTTRRESKEITISQQYLHTSNDSNLNESFQYTNTNDSKDVA